MEQEKKFSTESQNIDLLDVAKKVWKGKKTILKNCAISALVGIVISFSIPKEYTTTVTLASEVTRNSMSSSMSALASMAGINLGNSNNRDALSPLIYPDIVSSSPFAIELFDIPVKTIDGKIDTTLSDYLQNNTKVAWWSSLLKLPFKFIGWIKSLFIDKEESNNLNDKTDPFMLTAKESGVLGALKSRIKVDVDKQTAIITLQVTMQDPLVSAVLADSVTHKLQDYITNYRTSKARIDLEFAEKLYNETKDSYYKSLQSYADYVDKNQNVLLRKAQTQEKKLENDVQLAYGVYTQAAQQLQMAKAKVQENTPIYAVIQSASVPLKASKPSKMMIIVGLMFLTGVFTAGYLIFKDELNLMFKSNC